MRALSPLSLVLICWALTLAVALVALTSPRAFDLMPAFMAREDITLAAFTPLGALWLFTALAAWTVGDLAARTALPRRSPRFIPPDLARAARLTFLANLLLLGTTLLWITLTALQLGGFRRLLILTAAEALTARDFLLQNKLFTGMRLFYAALPATGCLAAALLATGALPDRARRLCRLTLLLNAIALTLLPIVMSQRLLLLQFTLSAYLVTCLIRRRLVALPWLILGAALFLGVWSLREALTNPAISTDAVPIGLQKLAFYMVNDLWNAVAPLATETPPTWGGITLHGVAVLTFTDGVVDQALAPLAPALDAIKGGGDFPLLTAPYVDFGPFGAALFLLLAGFTLRILFHRARATLLAAAIYAQCGAALLFSSHAPYLLHQNLLASLLVIALICHLSRRKAAPTAQIIPLPMQQTEALHEAA
ncbi:MAG: hypothetical protein EP318_16410 [Rhodobacteraceae bacterium]|nr:MAG: hypothetical protein EP318_16410 [Paracoccaceae bacterium]